MASRSREIKELIEKELSTQIAPADDFGVLDNLSLDERTKLTKWDLIIKQLVNKAINGDNKSMQEVLDRMFGKPQLEIRQDVNITNYTSFLENLAQLPDANLPPPEKPTIYDVTPMGENTLSGGNALFGENTLLEDLGLVDGEEEDGE